MTSVFCIANSYFANGGVNTPSIEAILAFVAVETTHVLMYFHLFHCLRRFNFRRGYFDEHVSNKV